MDTYKIFKNIYDEFSLSEKYCWDDKILLFGDSLSKIKEIPDHSISLILTDPPYHSTQKKNIVGDTNFKSNSEYVSWMQCYSKEWKRILKYNGSVFCFCSSIMATQLEMMFSEEFNILSQIVWTKPNEPGYDGWKQKMKKESLRQWYAHSERIIFMEPKYEGNLFQNYFGIKLREWRKKAGMSAHQLTELTGAYGKVNHGGAVSNWEAGRNIPSEEQFERIKQVLLATGNIEFIPDYKDIIRPFNVNKDVEFTDIWDFPNVRQYRGKHPAEKPLNLLEHAIKATTYSGDIVLDCFSGSGSTILAASNSKRLSIGIEIDRKWFDYTINRIEEYYGYKQEKLMLG